MPQLQMQTKTGLSAKTKVLLGVGLGLAAAAFAAALAVLPSTTNNQNYPSVLTQMPTNTAPLVNTPTPPTVPSAVFNPTTPVNSPPTPAPTYNLSIAKRGTGSGQVLVFAQNIPTTACGSSQAVCNFTYPAGVQLTLKASPATASTFGGWIGCQADSHTAYTCYLTVSGGAPSVVSPIFNSRTAQTNTLTIVKAGTGFGNVTVFQAGSAVVGSCSKGTNTVGAFPCSFSFPITVVATSLSLVATPVAGSSFAGWQGCTKGPNGTQCTLSLTANTTVTVAFNATIASPLTASDLSLITKKNTSLLLPLPGKSPDGCTGSFTFVVPATSKMGGTLARSSGYATCASTGDLTIAIVYTPPPDFTGADSFSYHFIGPNGNNISNTAIVTLNVQ